MGEVNQGPGVFIDGHLLDGAKQWWKKIGGLWSFEPEIDEAIEYMVDGNYTMLGTYAHGSRLAIWLGAKRLSTTKVLAAGKGKAKKRFVLMLNCYSFESDMTEALIGQHGCAITFKSTVAGLWGSDLIDKVLDGMLAEPNKPIYEIWLEKKRKWLSSFQPQFQGNRTITYNDVLRPYITKEELISAIIQYFNEDGVSSQDVYDLIYQHFNERS